MSYTALYRKFRPTEFEDVKGQDPIVTTLKNQIVADRIGHAYLFCGTRGTGKTTVAKIFARAVNCEHPVDGSPCGACASCRAIAAGTSMNVIEIDAASNNGVEDIREIREEVAYSPTEGRFKVYIIDEVHMLSASAFNALLKTLEEPPSYVIFILATTEAHRIPITILSRCQRYDFRRISTETIAGRLRELAAKEQVEADDRALTYIAKAADGSLRDGLSLLDQCIAFYLGQKLTYDRVLEVLGAVDIDVFSSLFRKLAAQQLLDAVRELDGMILQGRELSQLVTDFIWYLRNLLILKSDPAGEEMLDVSTENLARMREETRMVDADTLMRYIRVFSELSGQLRYASQKRVLVELTLIKVCRPAMEQNYDSILQRISELERRMEQGLPARQAEKAPEAKEEKRPKEKISPEALSKDVNAFVGGFPELRKKCGPWFHLVLMDAQVRPLPDDAGVQVILGKDYPVDAEMLEQTLGELSEKELGVKLRVQVSTPKTDTRPDAPVVDLSGIFGMEVEIEES